MSARLPLCFAADNIQSPSCGGTQRMREDGIPGHSQNGSHVWGGGGDILLEPLVQLLLVILQIQYGLLGKLQVALQLPFVSFQVHT